MLAVVFCLRLACGLAGSLFVLTGQPVGPRYFRTHFLIILGLSAAAAALLVTNPDAPALPAAAAALAALGGAVVWSLPRPYAGWAWVAATLALLVWAVTAAGPSGWGLVNGLTAAVLLGTTLSAMLMGHFYLIAPTLSLTPLLRMLAAMFAALGLRAAVALAGLWFWTESHSLANLTDETVLLLPVRWGLGLAAPLVLGWMAWQSARIRSTQSATGILYVVVIFCFLGELVSQLLGETGYTL